MGSDGHWGEIPPKAEDVPPPLTPEGRAQLLKPKAMKLQSLAVTPFQNANRPNDVHIPPYTPDLLYLVKLQRIWNKIETNAVASDIVLPKRTKSKTIPLGLRCLDLPREELNRLQRQVIVLVAHSLGYDDAKESSLDVLTDLLGQYLRRTSSALRHAVDTSHLRPNNHTDFVDILDRTFHEMRVPSVIELHQFWLNEMRTAQRLLDKILLKANVQTEHGTTQLVPQKEVTLIKEIKFFAQSPETTVEDEFPEFVIN